MRIYQLFTYHFKKVCVMLFSYSTLQTCKSHFLNSNFIGMFLFFIFILIFLMCMGWF